MRPWNGKGRCRTILAFPIPSPDRLACASLPKRPDRAQEANSALTPEKLMQAVATLLRL
jgi:hypothetical protein